MGVGIDHLSPANRSLIERAPPAVWLAAAAAEAENQWLPPPTPLPPRKDRIAFVVSMRIDTRFSAAVLLSTLHAIRQFHPQSRVLVVDNGSPSPLSAQVLPHTQWFRDAVTVLRKPGSPQRELSAFDAAITWMLERSESTSSEWRVGSFAQYVFMQGSMVLLEPVPSVAGAPGRKGCLLGLMHPLGPQTQSLCCGLGKRVVAAYVSYLAGARLRAAPCETCWCFNCSSRATAKQEAHLPFAAASHSSFTATAQGLQLLLARQGRNVRYRSSTSVSAERSIFGLTSPLVGKDQCENLVGMLIESAMQQPSPGAIEVSSGAKADAARCTGTHLGWRGAGPYIQKEAMGRFANDAVGYAKVHCSWAGRLSHFQALDPKRAAVAMQSNHGMAFCGAMYTSLSVASLMWLFRIVDSDNDGAIARGDVVRAARARPRQWARAWHFACLSAPIGRDRWAAYYATHGPAVPADGDAIATAVQEARERAASAQRKGGGGGERSNRHQQSGDGSCDRESALYWAEEALAVLADKPMFMGCDMEWRGRISRHWEPLQPMPPDVPLWAGEGDDPEESGEREGHAWSRERQRFVADLEETLFRYTVASDGANSFTFAELLAAQQRPGFATAVVLPNCLRSRMWSNPHGAPKRSLVVGGRLLNRSELARVSFSQRAEWLADWTSHKKNVWARAPLRAFDYRQRDVYPETAHQLAALFLGRAALHCLVGAVGVARRGRESAGPPNDITRPGSARAT